MNTRHSLRFAGSVVAGAIIWFVLATIFDRALRIGWPEYAAVEKAMTFTLPMMAARLSESAISSLLSGMAAAMAGRDRRAALCSGVVLFLMFLPLHYSIWPKFPPWYHLSFLSSLILLSAAGSFLVRSRRGGTQTA